MPQPTQKQQPLTNTPQIWKQNFPFPKADQHKYNRGHAIIAGGNIECTGATKLAAMSALRAGAGLVTVASPKNTLDIYAKCLTSVMAKPYQNSSGFEALITDPRKNAVLIGPGNGINQTTKDNTLAALNLKKNCVIDADAITSFESDPSKLFDAINSPAILTPHEGEFKRLFYFQGERIERAINAAKQSNAVIVLKGEKTIIAAPDDRLAINENAPPTLATAGSGDVLAGIIIGLLANNMDSFEAACAGVWIHGEAANKLGLGMISEDLPEKLPEVLKGLEQSR